jgi:hypothetical protein
MVSSKNNLIILLEVIMSRILMSKSLKYPMKLPLVKFSEWPNRPYRTSSIATPVTPEGQRLISAKDLLNDTIYRTRIQAHNFDLYLRDIGKDDQATFLENFVAHHANPEDDIHEVRRKIIEMEKQQGIMADRFHALVM